MTVEMCVRAPAQCRWVLLLLLLAAACRERVPGHTQWYRVFPPDSLSLKGEVLQVSIEYGGCGPARFALRHKVEDDEATLWLHRSGRNYGCESPVYESLTFTVPPEALLAKHIYFAQPEPRRFRLR